MGFDAGADGPAAVPDADSPTALRKLPTTDEMLARFDQLVESGIVKYDYSFTTETHNIKGVDFEFRISQALAAKPWTIDDPLANDRKLRPGSDISTLGYELGDLTGTHYLAFNGFACYRPHFLMLTLDGYRRQWEALDIDDFKALYAFSQTYGDDYLYFFNGGKEAGCSRVHKHMQAIPRESYSGKPWHNVDENAGSLPFAYFIEDLKPGTTPEEALKIYNRGLEAVERTLGSKHTEENASPPHNLLMDGQRLMIVPRRGNGIGQVNANATGMLGMIWTSSHEMKQKWLDATPWDVMQQGSCPDML